MELRANIASKRLQIVTAANVTQRTFYMRSNQFPNRFGERLDLANRLRAPRAERQEQNPYRPHKFGHRRHIEQLHLEPRNAQFKLRIYSITRETAQRIEQRVLARHPLAAACNLVGVTMINRSSELAASNAATFSSVAGSVVEHRATNVDGAGPTVVASAGDRRRSKLRPSVLCRSCLEGVRARVSKR